MSSEENHLSQLQLDYHFSSEEVQALARHFRNIQGEIPDSLISFATAIERAIYDVMSIDEAEAFYL